MTLLDFSLRTIGRKAQGAHVSLQPVPTASCFNWKVCARSVVSWKVYARFIHRVRTPSASTPAIYYRYSRDVIMRESPLVTCRVILTTSETSVRSQGANFVA